MTIARGRITPYGRFDEVFSPLNPIRDPVWEKLSVDELVEVILSIVSEIFTDLKAADRLQRNQRQIALDDHMAKSFIWRWISRPFTSIPRQLPEPTAMTAKREALRLAYRLVTRLENFARNDNLGARVAGFRDRLDEARDRILLLH